MESLFLTVAAVILVYVVVMVVLPKRLKEGGQTHTQRAMSRMLKENTVYGEEGEASLLKDQVTASTPMGRVALSLPFAKPVYALMLKAGFGTEPLKFLLGAAAFFLLLLMLLSRFDLGFSGFLFALILGIYGPLKYLQRRIRKRNEQFINQFPDALDMIVRSVRSGFPLNTALRMIADNLDPPVSNEFRQVVDEVSYGRSLNEALIRLSQRIDQPDIQFFVVVLSVQQESGGNLAEVLSNLSSVIRKRKQLRLKIKALTSEGRATAWVLGSLPVVVFGLLLFISPQHLQPLFSTHTGHLVLAGSVGLVATAAWVVSQMIDIDI